MCIGYNSLTKMKGPGVGESDFRRTMACISSSPSIDNALVPEIVSTVQCRSERALKAV